MINPDKQGEKGIYTIRNLVNNSVYVGKTARSFSSRWKQHVSELDNGIHNTLLLQRDWCILGESNFMFEVIELHYNKDSIREREVYWTEHYENEGFCYNKVGLHWWFYRRQKNPAYLYLFKDGEITKPSESLDQSPMVVWRDIENYYMEKHYKYIYKHTKTV